MLSSVLCKFSQNFPHSSVTPWMVSPGAVRLPLVNKGVYYRVCRCTTNEQCHLGSVINCATFHRNDNVSSQPTPRQHGRSYFHPQSIRRLFFSSSTTDIPANQFSSYGKNVFQLEFIRGPGEEEFFHLQPIHACMFPVKQYSSTGK